MSLNAVQLSFVDLFTPPILGALLVAVQPEPEVEPQVKPLLSTRDIDALAAALLGTRLSLESGAKKAKLNCNFIDPDLEAAALTGLAALGIARCRNCHCWCEAWEIGDCCA